MMQGVNGVMSCCCWGGGGGHHFWSFVVCWSMWDGVVVDVDGMAKSDP